MGRHSANTPSAPQARSRELARRRRAHAAPGSAFSRLRCSLSDRLGSAVATLDVRARRAGIPTSAVRPAGIVASSALVLSAVLGGGLVWSQQAPPAQAAEAFVTGATIEQTSGPTRTVQVHVDGKDVEVTSDATTLSTALREAGIVVGAQDVVSAPLGGPIPTEKVTIIRMATQLATSEDVDAHTSSEVEDANLPKGQRRVTTEGRDGVTHVVSRVTTHDGAEVSREEVARVLVSTRQDEVVAVGTKEEAAAPALVADAAQNSADAAPAAVSASGARGIAAQMVAARGWGNEQFQCLDRLWQKESNWNHTAQNPSSGAYGIPQSLPGSKMAAAGADWRTNPATQITWGLDYIAGRYGTPCNAWGHSQRVNWY